MRKKPESVHKITNKNKEKDAIYEIDDEEPFVTDNPVINEQRYFNLFECGKKLLNKSYSTCKLACMEILKGKVLYGNI